MSQSKKLMELAEVAQELQTTKAALERAERIVFIQRQEGVGCNRRFVVVYATLKFGSLPLIHRTLVVCYTG